MIMAEKTETLAAINNQYKIYELKGQCLDAEVLFVEVSLYNRVEDQISTQNYDLSVFC